MATAVESPSDLPTDSHESIAASGLNWKKAGFAPAKSTPKGAATCGHALSCVSDTSAAHLLLSRLLQDAATIAGGGGLQNLEGRQDLHGVVLGPEDGVDVFSPGRIQDQRYLVGINCEGRSRTHNSRDEKRSHARHISTMQKP